MFRRAPSAAARHRGPRNRTRRRTGGPGSDSSSRSPLRLPRSRSTCCRRCLFSPGPPRRAPGWWPRMSCVHAVRLRRSWRRCQSARGRGGRLALNSAAGFARGRRPRPFVLAHPSSRCSASRTGRVRAGRRSRFACPSRLGCSLSGPFSITSRGSHPAERSSRGSCPTRKSPCRAASAGAYVFIGNAERASGAHRVGSSPRNRRLGHGPPANSVAGAAPLAVDRRRDRSRSSGAKAKFAQDAQPLSELQTRRMSGATSSSRLVDHALNSVDPRPSTVRVARTCRPFRGVASSGAPVAAPKAAWGRIAGQREEGIRLANLGGRPRASVELRSRPSGIAQPLPASQGEPPLGGTGPLDDRNNEQAIGAGDRPPRPRDSARARRRQ